MDKYAWIEKGGDTHTHTHDSGLILCAVHYLAEEMTFCISKYKGQSKKMHTQKFPVPNPATETIVMDVTCQTGTEWFMLLIMKAPVWMMSHQ